MGPVFGTVAGIIMLGCAVAQYQISRGRADYDFWPFVKSESSNTQFAFACFFAAMAVVALVFGWT